MSVKFYKSEDVLALVPIRQYLIDAGVKVSGNRCVASWRGGDGLTCGIYEDKGFVRDYKENASLNVIDLCMTIEGLDFVQAKIKLAERYGVPATDGSRAKPKPKPKPRPNWTRVACFIINADKPEILNDALKRSGEDKDCLNAADTEWGRRVAGLMLEKSLSIDDALAEAVLLEREEAGL